MSPTQSEQSRESERSPRSTLSASRRSRDNPLLIRAIAIIGKSSQATVTVASLLILGSVGIMQNLTGLHVTLAPFYLVPIALVTLRTDRIAGLLFSTACGTLWISIHVGLSDYRFLWVDSWNNILRVGVFICFSLILSRLKDDAVRAGRLHRDLEIALKRVRELTGLLPICAWCKRIRDTEGNWQHVEAYVTVHSDAGFTHGICPECARREMEELEG